MRIIPNMGVCDPHVHIFNGKAYLFSTHDRSPGQPIFTMDDWRIFSSDDLLNWKLEYTLRPEDTFLGKNAECYATDAAERNGKYYFYYSRAQSCTGVAVSETGPAGPYHDPLGKPLLPPGFADTPSYDPTVFIDDDEDKTPYIMWGYNIYGKRYYIARLNEDMISLAEEPRPVVIEGHMSDACWLTKHGGKYFPTCPNTPLQTASMAPMNTEGPSAKNTRPTTARFSPITIRRISPTASPKTWGPAKRSIPITARRRSSTRISRTTAIS